MAPRARGERGCQVTPLDRFLEKLDGVKVCGAGWTARCPAHEDRNPSLSVSAGADGRVLVKCHRGCAAAAVCAALGLSLRDLMPDTNEPSATFGGQAPGGRAPNVYPTAEAALESLKAKLGASCRTWTYHDPAGRPVGLVARWDTERGKDIRPVSRCADGWAVAAMPGPRPLYGLPSLSQPGPVLVVEGEPCADAARALGFVSTTSVGGAQAAKRSDWSPLAGREVYVLPDHDDAGRKYASDVAHVLARVRPCPTVKVLDPAAVFGRADLPPGYDLADALSECKTDGQRDQLRSRVESAARAAGPDVPEPDAADEPPRPFPVGSLPQPIRRFVTAGARAIGCDVSYLVLPLLVALASAIGMTRRLELKRGWSAPAIIWAVIVGESGTSKTPAFALVMRPVRERQRRALERYAEECRQYESDLARWEKELAAWKKDKHAADDPPEKPTPPRCERLMVSDTTVEALAPILMDNPRGVMLARDELAGWLGSFDRYAGKGKAGADAANWLSMFNAETIIVDRKTGLPRTIHVPQAAVCVTGGIQPGILRRALSAEHRESGLAARLLVSWPARKVKKWTEADIDPRAEAELVALFDRLYELQPADGGDGPPRPVLLQLDSGAKAAWVAYYDAHAAEQAGLTGDLAAAWSKLEEYAPRLALVVHLTRWAAGDPSLADACTVDATSMRAGITMAEWFKHEARRVYEMLSEPDADADRRRLVEWLGRRGGSATAREVQQGCRWLKAPGTAEAALEDLVKTGRGSWRPPGTTTSGGRPTRVFVLSTPSTVYETPATHVESEGFVDVDTVDATAAPVSEPEPFPFGANNPDDPDGDRLFTNPEARGLPD